MKKNLFCLLLILSISATKLFAQQPQSQSDTSGKNMGQAMHEKMKMFLRDSVQLSSALVDSVINLRMQYQPQYRDIYMNQSLTDADRQVRLGDIRTQINTRYKDFGLTESQIQRINDRDMRMTSQWQNRPPGTPEGKP